ncbi:MAG: alpha/beta hydrolase [Betaproteobacteria bacterium]|nr:alpha/beta hydrolase [Betaproteobacteria bacterium]
MRLSPAELDRQYNARAAIPEHPQIFARWTEDSAQARLQGGCEPDYYYGGTPDETLDFFPACSPNAPLLVFIHGGWWRSLDKRDFSFLAPPFVEAGAAVALINYSLAPKARIEDIVRQSLHACAWCRRNARSLGIDPERMYVAGHSAGGHLAAMMLAADWPAWAADLPPRMLRGGLAVSGLFDLEPISRTPFLKQDLRLGRDAARRASPVRIRPPHGALLHTAVGGEESTEFHRQTRLIREAWPHCAGAHLRVDGKNHLTVVDALAAPGQPLHDAALRMLGIHPNRV